MVPKYQSQRIWFHCYESLLTNIVVPCTSLQLVVVYIFYFYKLLFEICFKHLAERAQVKSQVYLMQEILRVSVIAGYE